jgi:thiol-disulfide isomerase/thioredoxin
MKLLAFLLASSFLTSALAQETKNGPTSEKAQKTYQQAMDLVRQRKDVWALDAFKKADKQDDGRCLACQQQIITFGIQFEDWKAAQQAAEEMVAEAQGDKEIALAHYEVARVLTAEGSHKHKDNLFAEAHDEITRALAACSSFPDAVYLDGKALANLKKDEEAKARFEQYLEMNPSRGPDRRRVQRFISRPELARARMAPPFTITTADGARLSMDDLQGKVVLLDFWAIWCVPCREALPHIREVAKKFHGEPLVILSITLDSDEQKWKEFIAKNEMTWPQYRDGAFTGPIAKMFGVNAIPHTFTIDADGVLQDEHIGDGSIEGKMKKLIAGAHELQSAENSTK